MAQLREFLRHQYIGAIVIALLAYQGIAALISAVVAPIVVFATNYGARSYGNANNLLNWTQILPSVVHAVLALVLAYLLLRWLYVNKSMPTTEETTEAAE